MPAKSQFIILSESLINANLPFVGWLMRLPRPAKPEPPAFVPLLEKHRWK